MLENKIEHLIISPKYSSELLGINLDLGGLADYFTINR